MESNARKSFNHGFWDGFHDAEANRKPIWEGRKHPNPIYEGGYNAGTQAFAANPNEISSDSAWVEFTTNLTDLPVW